MVSQCHRKLLCRDKKILDGSIKKYGRFSEISCAGMWLMKSRKGQGKRKEVKECGMYIK